MLQNFNRKNYLLGSFTGNTPGSGKTGAWPSSDAFLGRLALGSMWRVSSTLCMGRKECRCCASHDRYLWQRWCSGQSNRRRTTPGIPGKRLEFEHFLTGPWKTPWKIYLYHPPLENFWNFEKESKGKSWVTETDHCWNRDQEKANEMLLTLT